MLPLRMRSHLAYLGRSIAKGEVPLWNPYDRGGYPFAADPQSGLLYLFNWPFALIGAIVWGDGGAPAGLMKGKALAHHALLGTLMDAWRRTRKLPPVAAVFGGVAVVLSIPIVIHKASNLLWPIAWTPLVWIAIDRAVAGGAKRDGGVARRGWLQRLGCRGPCYRRRASSTCCGCPASTARYGGGRDRRRGEREAAGQETSRVRGGAGRARLTLGVVAALTAILAILVVPSRSTCRGSDGSGSHPGTRCS